MRGEVGKGSFVSRGLKQLASGLGVQKRRNTWRATKLDSWRSEKTRYCVEVFAVLQVFDVAISTV